MHRRTSWPSFANQQHEMTNFSFFFFFFRTQTIDFFLVLLIIIGTERICIIFSKVLYGIDLDNREFKKPQRPGRGQCRFKNEVIFYLRISQYSFTLFITVKTITKLNLEYSDNFEIEI